MGTLSSTEIVPDGEVPGELLRELAEWMRRMFGEEELKYTWADIDWHVLLWYEGRLASHAAITERVAEAGGETVKLAGIGGLMTPGEWRGRGMASAVMLAAAAFLRDELHVDFGLLLCSKKLAPFYRGLGWETVRGPVTFDQPGRKEQWAEETMVLQCTERDWPSGPIDLRGLPW